MTLISIPNCSWFGSFGQVSPFLFIIYESAMMFVFIVRGLTSALTRLCYYLIVILCALLRLDYSMLPDPFKSLDGGYTAFTCMAALDHRRAPAVRMAASALLERSAGDGPPSVARKRWRKALTL